MASVQKQFEAFDDAIRLGRFEENQTLRDKRDIIRKKLESRLPDIFEVHREVCPKFFFLDQGSYDMGTGIKPLDGDYDIDQGLYFVACYADYPDPVLLKKRVYEALEGHTQDVCIRQPCVTVFYQEAGESIYHVDIAVYSDGSSNNDGKVRLARGKEYSAQENRRWEISDPQELSETIFAKFTNESDRDQFRRIVRYLKQWKNVNFSMDGRAAPIGIGLTIAAYDNLQPVYTPFDYTDNDLEALRRLVRAMLNRFALIWDPTEKKSVPRLSVQLPVEPRNDLFLRMTNLQMETFKEMLQELLDVLDIAAEEVDPVEACKELSNVFGDAFPVPTKEETGKRYAPAIVSSSSSA